MQGTANQSLTLFLTVIKLLCDGDS